MTTTAAPTPTPDPLARDTNDPAAIVAARDVARDAKARARTEKQTAAGVVLALAATHREQMPPFLMRAVDRYLDTCDEYDAISAIAADLGKRATQAMPNRTAESAARVRLDVMLAHYVVGLALVLNDRDDDPYRAAWRVADAGGKLKPVPSYTTDLAVVGVVERAMTQNMMARFGQALAAVTLNGDLQGIGYSARLALASPLERTVAILRAAGLDPDNPPAWVRDEAAPPPLDR